MPFSKGSSVVVLTLGKKRGVVVEAGRGGHYRVQVEHATVSCREHDLVAAPDEQGRKRDTPNVGRGFAPRQAGRKGPPYGEVGSNDAGPASRIDLHGLTVEEALAKVVEEIDWALRRGTDRIEVVHGKGSGRIRNALHRQLATMTVVAAFRLDPRNPGVTWVYF